MSGFMNAASLGRFEPLLEKAADTSDIEYSKAANPGAYTAGSLAGSSIPYMASGDIVSAIPKLGAATAAAGSAVSKWIGKIPKVGQAAAKFITPDRATRLIAGREVDLIPDIVRAATSSDSAGEFAKNMAVDTVMGLGFDTGLEIAGAGIKAGIERMRPIPGSEKWYNAQMDAAARKLPQGEFPKPKPVAQPEPAKIKPVEPPTLKPLAQPPETPIPRGDASAQPVVEPLKPATQAETPILRPKGWEDMQPAKAIETPLKADSGAQGAIGKESIALEWTPDDSKTYRYTRGEKPMSDWGHAMFADDPYQFGDPYHGIMDDRLHSVQKAQLTDIDDIKGDIAKQWESDKASGRLENYGFSDDQLELSADDVADLFDPIDIVDSAEAYDSAEFLTWLSENVIEPKAIVGIKTQDGGIVFDESLIKRDYDSIVEALRGSNADSPKLSAFGKNTVGAAESKFPRKQKTSKVFSNTFENSNLFTQAEKNVSSLLLTDADIKYDVITEKQSLAEAAERLAHDFDGEVAELPTKAYFDSADTDAAMMVLERRIQEARESGNYDEVLRWTRIIKEKGTEAGQRIQAFAKYSRTPEHALVQAQRVVDSVEDAIKAPMKNGKYPAGAKPKLWKKIEDETSRVVDAVKKAEKSASQAAAETIAAVSKAIKKSVKELGEDLNNIIKQSKGDKEKLLQNVKDYILENTGITGDNADILAERVTEQYRKILAEKTEAALNNMFRELTPKGKKSTKQRIMELINMGAYDDAAIKDAIKQRHGLPVLEPEDVKQILDYMEQAAKLPENSRERLILEAKAAQVVRNKKPVGLKDKFITTLYDNMLGNFRTLISRNAGGNLMFAIPEAIREVPTAMIDKGVSLVTGERTRTMPSLKKLKAYGQGFAKGFSDQISDYKLRVNTPTSGNVVDFDGKPTKVFKNKIMDELDRLVKTGLSLGDRPFYEASYAKRLAELEEIKNMGKLGKEFDGKDFDEIASMLAKADALEATFQSKGIISEGLEKIKQGLGNLSKGYFGVDLLSQTTLPFTRTLGDLAERAIEYSPVGIGLNTVKTIGEVAGGNFNQRRFVDEAGRNLLGLGAAAAAYAGVKSGNIVGSLSKDKDERAAQYQAGMRPYSVKIGDTWHTYDWVPGIGAAVAATADAAQSMQNNETLPSTLGNILKATGNSLVEQQPVAQGLKSLVGYGDIASGVGNTILSGTGQLVPSFVRQAANTLDPITRETYDPNPLKQQLNYLKSGVPGLRQTLPQKVDTTGEGVLQNQGRGLASRAMENMLIPQLISQVTSDPVRNELLRINKEKGETKQFLKSADKTLTVDGEKYHLDTETYIQYQTLLGQKTNSIVSDMIQSAYYKRLSDEEKAEAIYSAQVYANALAKRDILNAMGVDYEPDSKYLKQEALEQAGVPYVKQWEIYSTANADGNNSISQQEYTAALVRADLTPAERAYMFRLQNEKWKKNPFEISEKTGVPMSALEAYYAAESSKKPNGDTISGSLKRNTINAMVKSGATRQQAIKFWNEMYK
jgi:hypothetical protein